MTDEKPHARHEPDASARRSTRERWVLLALLLLALCIGIGVGAALNPRFEAAQAASAPIPACEMQPTRVEIRPSPARAPCEMTPSAATPSSETAPASARAPSASSSKGTPTTRVVHTSQATPDAGAPPRALGPDLHEALRLLRAAQRALRIGEAAHALARLEEMARRAPDMLVEEREVTRVLALCAAKDVDGARRTASALRGEGAASVYAHRLSQSCVGPAPAPASLVGEMRRRARN